FFVRGIVKLIFCSPQRGLGGFYRRLEGHRIDLEKHVAFLDRPVWLNRHLGHLTGYARNDRNHVVHRAHVVSCGRGNVQKQQNSQLRHRDNRKQKKSKRTHLLPPSVGSFLFWKNLEGRKRTTRKPTKETGGTIKNQTNPITSEIESTFSTESHHP